MNEQEGNRMTQQRPPYEPVTDAFPPIAPVPPPAVGPTPAPPAAPVVVRGSTGPGILGVVLGIAVLFAIGGVAFAAGRLTAPAPVAATGGNGSGGAGGAGGFGFGRGNGNNGNGAGNGNGNPFGNGGGNLGAAGVTIKGTVTAVAADHITVQLAGGQTVDIPIDASTSFHRQTPSARTDVSTGASVEVALSGRFGRGGVPGASAAPSGSTGPGGRTLGTATDVTITGG
jgi:Domain of unknown function (DUF5666)